MSESMRMQSELVADLEVYRAKGELIALRAENATLRQLLLQYRATLDATTPDSNQLGDINDMVSKGGDGE